MSRYRKILVAYDGSVSARNALKQASIIAKENKSWIKVLAVVPAYAGDLELIGVRNIKDTIEGPGRKLLAEAQEIADTEDVHVLTNLEQGEPYEKIVHVADEENCDLIVMGRRGLSAIERELMGGVTARVIGHTSKDVLVVSEGQKVGWHNILLATDGSRNSEAAVEKALELAKERSARLTAIAVVFINDEFFSLAQNAVNELIDNARSILDGVEEKAASQAVEIETHVKQGEPHDAITKLAGDIGAEIIVMGSHGRKGLRRLLMGSVTERVIGFSPCPILVVHSK